MKIIRNIDIYQDFFTKKSTTFHLKNKLSNCNDITQNSCIVVLTLKENFDKKSVTLYRKLLLFTFIKYNTTFYFT